MKINSASNLVVMTDLHDTLIHSKKAWLRAFKNVCGKNSRIYITLKNDYENVWKRELCKKSGTDYETVKNEYLKYIERKEPVIKLIKSLECPVIIVSNAKRYRILEDTAIVPDLKFDKIYSRDDGVKPQREYIERIIEENNISYAIMLGNDEIKDTFGIDRIKTLLVGNKGYLQLKSEFNKLLKELTDDRNHNSALRS